MRSPCTALSNGRSIGEGAELNRPSRAAAAVMLAWFGLAIAPARAVAEEAESAHGGIFSEVALARGASREVMVDSRGDVWTVTGSGAVRIPGGVVEKAIVYPFGNATSTLVTTFSVLANGEVWVGMLDGSAARLRDGKWTRIPIPADRYGRQRVTGFALHRGIVYRAAVTVSRWSEDAANWALSSDLGTSWSEVTSTPAGDLAVAGPSGIAMCTGRAAPFTCRNLWRGADSDDWIGVLEVDAVGRVFAGTSDGYVVLDRDGALPRRELRGRRVTAIAPDLGGRMWVGTGGDGLLHFDGETWHTLGYREGFPTDRVTGVAIDRRQQLWVVGRGLWVAPLGTARARIRELYRPVAATGLEYADACDAATALLAEKAESGAVAKAAIDGRLYVWFGAMQVCPGRWFPPHARDALATARRGDGALATMAFDGARFSASCLPKPCPPDQTKAMAERWQAHILHPVPGGFRRTAVPSPDPVPTETPNGAILLDAQDRLWLGSHDDGLRCFADGAWVRYAEPQFPPRSRPWRLVADPSGAVWVGSSPDFDRSSARYPAANLHRFEGKTWSGWSPDDGLGYWSTSALQPLAAGGAAVGTNGGLSIVSARGEVTTYAHGALEGGVGIVGVHEDREGWLWIVHGGDGSGLTWYDGVRFGRMTSRDGLFSDRLQAVALDGEDRVWLIDDRGHVGVYPRASFAARQQRTLPFPVEEGE